MINFVLIKIILFNLLLKEISGTSFPISVSKQISIKMKNPESLRYYVYHQLFYTPVEDGTYYGITRVGRASGWRAGIWVGGRASGLMGGRRPVLCPEHISKTTLARVMKFHGWIDLIQGECSAQES